MAESPQQRATRRLQALHQEEWENLVTQEMVADREAEQKSGQIFLCLDCNGYHEAGPCPNP